MRHIEISDGWNPIELLASTHIPHYNFFEQSANSGCMHLQSGENS